MLRVLVIDDDPAVVAFLTEELAAHHDVDGETSARAALARLGDYDLVIADVEMPELRGTELLRASRTPMLMITAFATPELERQLLAMGARGVLAKPFSIARLLAAISTSIARDPARPTGAPAPH